MRTIFLASCLMFLSFFTKGQDTLYKWNEPKKLVKVTEINQNSIKYKTTGDTNDATWVISKQAVNKVVFQNGRVEIYSSSPTVTVDQPVFIDPYTLYSHNHLISVNLIDLIYARASLTYEQFFYSGKMSFKVPVTISFKPREHYGFINQYSFQNLKNYSFGANLNLYPSGQGAVRYFIGLGLEKGSTNIIDEYTSKVNKDIDYTALLLNNGIAGQLSKHFTVTLLGGAVYSPQLTKYNNTGIVDGLYFNIQLNLGYRF